jgi:hypothetical protein
MLVFRQRRAGIASLLEAIPGVGSSEERIPIVSASDGKLVLGNEKAIITYKRASDDAP